MSYLCRYQDVFIETHNGHYFLTAISSDRKYLSVAPVKEHTDKGLVAAYDDLTTLRLDLPHENEIPR